MTESVDLLMKLTMTKFYTVCSLCCCILQWQYKAGQQAFALYHPFADFCQEAKTHCLNCCENFSEDRVLCAVKMAMFLLLFAVTIEIQSFRSYLICGIRIRIRFSESVHSVQEPESGFANPFLTWIR